MKSIMTKWLKPIAFTVIGALFVVEIAQALTVDFGDLSLSSESQWDGVDTTYDNGSGDENPFESRGATFSNFHEYSDPWGYGPTHYWDGWAYSNRTDLESTGTSGQYTAIADPAGGQNDSNYGVAYFGWNGHVPTVDFTAPSLIQSAYFTNNAYAYHSMLDGDSFAKQFGGATGSDSDWFKLTIIGKDAAGGTTNTLDFYLADYRFENSGDDYIIDDWTLVDLTSLGNNVSSLEFSLASSDTGGFGMNTPAYFAMDSMTVVPEPSTIVLGLIGLLAMFAWGRWRRG